MPFKAFRKTLVQSVADGVVEEVVKIPVNSMGSGEMPLIRILYMSLFMMPDYPYQWSQVVPIAFNVEIATYPITPKQLIFEWALVFSPGQIAIDTFREFYPPDKFPLIKGNQLLMSMDSLGTTVANEVFVTIFYEEVLNPSDLDITLGYVS
jgi:hypothetical protein